MCYIPIEQLDEKDYMTIEERSMSTGSLERFTRFRDGTTIRHCGAMCGDIYYDEYGEEC